MPTGFVVSPNDVTEVVISELPSSADGWFSRDHTLATRTTEYPVESGANLTDHARDEPNRLVFSGWVSDLVAYPGVLTNAVFAFRGLEAWQNMISLQERKVLTTVTTPIAAYLNMLLRKAEAHEGADTGSGLIFTLEFQQVLRSTDMAATTQRPSTGAAQDRLDMQTVNRVFARAPTGLALDDVGNVLRF